MQFSGGRTVIRRRTCVVIGLVAGFLLGVGTLWLVSPPNVQVIGALAPKDVAEISELVHREMGQGGPILPNYSWRSIRGAPREYLRRRSHRILSMDVAGDGTVEVRAGGSTAGTTYILRKGPAGWEVASRRFWKSL